MKKISILLLFLSFAIVSFAAKTYTLTLTVKDKVTSDPLALTSIFLLSTEGKVLLGKTDLQGNIEVEGLTKESITLSVEAQSEIYDVNEVVLSNTKLKNISETILMRYTYKEQMKIYDAIDEKYNNPDEKYIDGIKKPDTVRIEDAEFIGGKTELMKFLAKNMTYPEDCITNGIEGKVYLSFFIQKDGKVTHVKAVRKVHPSLDLEAIRTMRKSPNWKPATRNGEPIKSVFYIPVNFRLN
ncbi:MAG: energy transducer TonB [Crocinitomicaceae bacterium]|nr:energy transducer TonB [Crocinitomicaceae bacterium]